MGIVEELLDESELVQDIQRTLNRHSQENMSGTPDFILAQYLKNCLYAFSVATNQREKWYGRQQNPRFGTPEGV